MKRKQWYLWLTMIGLLWGCRDAQTTPTPAPTAVPPAETATAVVDTPATETPAPTALVEATATEATATEAPATEMPATEAPATEAPAVDTATATVAATATEAATATTIPTATATAVPEITAGQQDTMALATSASNEYLYIGDRFQPVLLFVEPADTLDVALAVAPWGEETALHEADFSRAGGPELMVFTPQEGGTYSLMVTAVAGAGDYTLYLFDTRTTVPGVVVQAGVAAAGEAESYTVQSNGSRPILVFVAPDSNSDVAIQVQDQSGEIVVEADFGGRASSEALFVLSQQTTTYTVLVSSATGDGANYNILIAALPAAE